MLWNQRTMEDQWQNARHFNGSNMSLNLPSNGYYPQSYEPSMGPPGAWVNYRNGIPPDMYRYAAGNMPPIYPNQGNGRPIADFQCETLNGFVPLIFSNFLSICSIYEAPSKYAVTFSCTIACRIASAKHQVTQKCDV